MSADERPCGECPACRLAELRRWLVETLQDVVDVRTRVWEHGATAAGLTPDPAHGMLAGLFAKALGAVELLDAARDALAADELEESDDDADKAS